jgi:hypothetical protein
VRARRLAVVVLVVLGTTLVPARIAAAGERATLPPSSRKELVAIFGPKVKEYGLRVTRAALVNPRQERDPDGTHLAIYVEPTGDYTPQDYIDGTVDVTRVFLPYVFTRWKGLQSFDVCQEPRPAVDDRPVPAPETQVYATRAGSKLVDWRKVDVTTMLERSQAEAEAARTQRPLRFSLFVAKHLQNTPAYQQVAGISSTATPTTAPAAVDYG